MLGGIIRSRTVQGVFLDNWLLKLEKKAFGWNFVSSWTEKDTEHYYDSNGKPSTRTNYTEKFEFRRKSPYSHNFFFCLTEFFSNIFSFIRRIIAMIIVPLLVLGLILGLVTLIACQGADGLSQQTFIITGSIAVAYVGLMVIPSLLLAGLGFLWRKIFRIDEKLMNALAERGLDPDLTHCYMRGDDD